MRQCCLEVAYYSVQILQSGHVLSAVRQSFPANHTTECFAVGVDAWDLNTNDTLISWISFNPGSTRTAARYTSLIGNQIVLHNDAFAHTQHRDTGFHVNTIFCPCRVILLLDALVDGPKRTLPHMPTSIVSIMCLFEGSSLATGRGK